MEKIGLVLEGGGIRGAYTAGAVKWLNDNNITFDYGVGISSGAVYLTLYWQNETKIAYDLATNYSIAPDIVGLQALLKEGHFVAYGRLFNEVLKKQAHMTIQPLLDQKANIEIGCYVLDDGRTEYYGIDQMDDSMQILLGTCALPIASAIVKYRGKNLLDGGITKMIPIERALEQGCTKTLVITTKPKDYVRKPASKIVEFLMKILYRKYPQVAKDYHVRHLNYYHQVEVIQQQVDQGKAIHILPSKNIKVSRYKGDPEKTNQLYELGYQDMEARRQEIMEFLQK